MSNGPVDLAVRRSVQPVRLVSRLTATRTSIAAALAALRQAEDALERQLHDLRGYISETAARPRTVT